MTEDELKAIEERARIGLAGIISEGGGPSSDAGPTCEQDVPALVAEVRRLHSKLRWYAAHLPGCDVDATDV